MAVKFKYLWKWRPRITKTILKKNIVGGFTLPNWHQPKIDIKINETK